jgi:hypothetical protein
LNWPLKVKKALEVFSIVFSSLDLLVSFECLYLMSGAAIVAPTGTSLPDQSGFSPYYLKVIAYGILPILLIVIIALLLIIRSLWRAWRGKPAKF